MPTKKPPSPNPYGKQASTPLMSPQTDSAVNYAQLPENVMWLSGNRGFKKRYGSLPCAKYSALANMPVMLSAIRTPVAAYKQANETNSLGSRYLGITSLLTYFGGINGNGNAYGLYEFAKMRGLFVDDDLSTNNKLTRAPYTRTDTHYYLNGRNLSPTQTTFDLGDPQTPTAWQTLNEVGAQTTGATINSDFSQNTLPALFVHPDGVSENIAPADERQYPVLSQQRPSGWDPTIGSTLVTSFSAGSTTALGTDAGIFIAGAAIPPQHYDGFRSYLAGCLDVAGAALTLGTAGGALTGTYKYFVTHKITLPSGEVIESDPSPTVSQTLAAQQSTMSLALTLGAITYKTAYRTPYYSTSTTGTTSTVVVNASGVGTGNDLTPILPGEQLMFFISGVRNARTVTSVSGSTITLSASVALTGTTYFSSGGGLAIYRTKADTDVFYLLREVPFDSSATVALANDNAADSTLVTQYTSTATLRAAAPRYSYGQGEFKGRWVVLSGGGASLGAQGTFAVPSLWWSSSLSKFYFDPANSVPFEYEEHSTPQGVCSVNDTLYIFFSNSIYMLQGTLDDATTFTVSRLSDSIGCIAAKSICRVGSSVFFMSQKGLAEIRGTTIDYAVGEQVRKPILEDATTTDFRCYFWQAKQLLLLSANTQVQKVDEQNNATPTYTPSLDLVKSDLSDTSETYTAVPKTYVYDFESNRWALWSIDTFYGATEYEGDLLYISSPQRGARFVVDGYTDYVYRLSEHHNWTDSGKPFTARYYTEWYDAGVPSVAKSFDRAQIFSTDTKEAGGQGFKLTVRTERDWQAGLTVDEFTDLTDFKVDTGYAEQPYDTQPYGDPELSQKVLPLSNQRCNSLRVVIENSEPNRNFAINGVSVEVSPKYVNMKDE